jgi:hypothetical protein
MTRLSTLLASLPFIILLSACNFPAVTSTEEKETTEANPSPIITQVSTVDNQYTLSPQANLTTPSLVSSQIFLISTTPKLTPVTSPTQICNRILPGVPFDISIPDDTTLSPGESFSKTWRFTNGGSCSWTSEYTVVFFSGDLMGAARVNSIGSTVKPGQSIDITLDLTAPLKGGTYQGNWEFSDPNGNLFGLGPNGDAPFWVRIIVVAPNTSTPTPLATITPTLTPGVLVTGLTNLKPDDHLDLDTNQINIGEYDLTYTIETDGQHILTPENGSAFSSFGNNAPSHHDCISASQDSTPLDLDSTEQGTYFCFSSSAGSPGWIRLVALNTQDHTLTLEVLTWSIF